MSEQAVQAAFPGSNPTGLTEQIGAAAKRLEDIAGEMKEAKASDTARFDALHLESARQGEVLTELKAKHDAEKRDAEVQAAVDLAAQWKAQLTDVRTPSKARVIGGGAPSDNGPKSGAFISGVFEAASRDYRTQEAAKAALDAMGMRRQDPIQEGLSKATLSTSDATGGWIVPNAIVADLIKPAAVKNIYRDLMTTITGVTAFAIDLPVRTAARNRAVIAAFGATKENVDVVYNGYTATMYTLARIHDIGNQFLRQSAGAAEQDIFQELGAAFAQGESYYIREGSGSSQPYGYMTALTGAPGAFRSAFTPSATTLAGSMAVAITTAAGALAGRGVMPNAAVLSASSYWTMVSQGTDTAGFFFAPAGGPTQVRPGTLLTPWGLPVYPDADADLEGTAAIIDNLVVADWSAFKLFFGQNYRVDSSDVAGTRWDANVTGFRGEEEMGFDGRPAVYAGYAQQINDIVP